MKNPPWHRDEIILALDLYFRLNRSQIDSRNPDIIELSRLLNRLPIFDKKPDEVKFRNPNGVCLKLANFSALDKSYSGKGMSSYSKLDEIVFTEFEFNNSELHKIANQIKRIADDPLLPNELYLIPNEEEGITDSVHEGAVLFKLHKYRERDIKIVKKKKEIEFNKYGKLLCEACEFDFHTKYGDLGFKFIECHHRVPLSEYKGISKTTLIDLALVCSNCHRMLHKGIDRLSIEGLKQIISI